MYWFLSSAILALPSSLLKTPILKSANASPNRLLNKANLPTGPPVTSSLFKRLIEDKPIWYALYLPERSLIVLSLSDWP